MHTVKYSTREAESIRARRKCKTHRTTDAEFAEHNQLRRQLDIIIARAMTEAGTVLKRALLAKFPEVRGSLNRPDVVLTPRQEEVMELILASRWHSTKDIAAKLNLSVYGVRYHVKNILAKFGVKHREELARIR